MKVFQRFENDEVVIEIRQELSTAGKMWQNLLRFQYAEIARFIGISEGEWNEFKAQIQSVDLDESVLNG